MLRQRQERGRTAVVGDELLDRDAPCERDRVLETEPADVSADTIKVTARHVGRTDQVEVRASIRLAVFGEPRYDVVDRLVRKDLAHGKDRGALVGKLARHLRVGGTVKVIPRNERRDDRCVAETSLFELLPVVLAVGDTELGSRRELTKLLTANFAVAHEVVVQPFEVPRRSDVVIDDRLPDG